MKPRMLLFGEFVDVKEAQRIVDTSVLGSVEPCFSIVLVSSQLFLRTCDPIMVISCDTILMLFDSAWRFLVIKFDFVRAVLKLSPPPQGAGGQNLQPHPAAPREKRQSRTHRNGAPEVGLTTSEIDDEIGEMDRAVRATCPTWIRFESQICPVGNVRGALARFHVQL